MTKREIFTDDDGCTFSAELIPAKVVITRSVTDGYHKFPDDHKETPGGDIPSHEKVVGTIEIGDGDIVANLSIEECLIHGAGPFAKSAARELLGLPTGAEIRAAKAKTKVSAQ